MTRSKDHSSDKSGQEAGYKNPPKSRQFKKGQSGNPGGRPKKKVPPKPPRFSDGLLSGQLEHEAYRPIMVRENGVEKHLPFSQALLRSMEGIGLKGNRLALQFLYREIREQEAEVQTKVEQQYWYFHDMKQKGEAYLALCEERGIEPEALYPHPADIILDDVGHGVRIIGPLDANMTSAFEQISLFRDYFIYLFALMHKSMNKSGQPPEQSPEIEALIIAQLLNKMLPPSWAASEKEFSDKGMDSAFMTRKELVAERKIIMAKIIQLQSEGTSFADQEQAAEGRIRFLSDSSEMLEQMARSFE